MKNSTKRYVITKTLGDEEGCSIKVYQEEVEVDRMIDITYEVVEYMYGARSYSKVWEREEGLIIKKEQVREFVRIMEGKGFQVELYQR